MLILSNQSLNTAIIDEVKY